MAQISLCMIVKDEAESLPSFFQRVRGLWDELIVVDTGSTDGTQALVDAEGAIRIDHPWSGDFAEARNVGLERATGDWIAFFDPDEELSATTVRSLRAIATDPAVGAASVQMTNPMPHGNHRSAWLLRMFRNRPTIRFRYAIHEDITADVAEMLRAEGKIHRRAAGRVLHTGYLRERARERSKLERDSAVLRRCIEDDPDDLYSRYKLVEVALFWGERERAARAAEELLEAVERLGSERVVRLHYAGKMLEMLGRALWDGDPGTERSFLERWLERLPDSPELRMRAGIVCERCGDTEAAAEHYRRCLALRSDHLQLVGLRPRMGLARVAMAAGRWREALRRAEAALEESPLDVEALAAWLFCSVRSGSTDAVEQRVRRTLQEAERRGLPAMEARLALARAAETVGLDPWADRLYEALPDGAYRLDQARLKLRIGDLRGARQCIERSGDAPEREVGRLVCDLIEGHPYSGAIALGPAEAKEELRRWAMAAKRSSDRRFVAMLRCNAGAVRQVFPELPGWLGEDHGG